jgi:hypothetical protein
MITERQLALIKRAARLLSAEEKNAFFRSVASRLAGVDPGDDAVRAAVRFILNNRGVGVGRAFLHMPSSKRRTTNETHQRRR